MGHNVFRRSINGVVALSAVGALAWGPVPGAASERKAGNGRSARR
ncbi:hypothetical protein FHT44_001187 [Mycolicibacterium sp. BK634]|nr:hypothetical protein [Mycolicibacterium sp. BK634]MBB3748726.1 hypothetical protein [Mycolicibacterium sp. BK634]